MKRVTQIELHLENCEVMSFTTKEIRNFVLDNITECVSRYGCNFIGKTKQADHFYIELLPCANHTYDSWGEQCNNFERLQAYNDITQVIIHYEDDSEEMFLVPWGEDDNINEYQVNYLSKSGTLCILVSKNGQLGDWVCYEAVDDPDDPFLEDWYE